MKVSSSSSPADRIVQTRVREYFGGAILATLAVIIAGPLQSASSLAEEIAKPPSSEAADAPAGFREMLLGAVDSTGKAVAIQTRSLTADDDDHRIVLARQFVIRGTVTDASTGEPISSFRVTPAYGKPIPRLQVPAAITGQDGEYRYTFDDPSFFYYLLFEAEGYASVQSEVFSDTDEGIQFDVQLNKTPER